ncbi:MAG: InlB B-repeat-containing protein [Lachnospiraceae bacterium]|nr:InlB B-repeat-containing protein [Lachnospiraceae bacterium]
MKIRKHKSIIICFAITLMLGMTNFAGLYPEQVIHAADEVKKVSSTSELEDAINNATTSGKTTIALKADISASELNIKANTNVVIHYNGHTLSADTINVKGTLEMAGSGTTNLSGTGKGIVVSESGSFKNTNGKLSKSGSDSIVTVNDNGSFTINGGSVEYSGSDPAVVIDGSSAKANINGGTIKNTGSGQAVSIKDGSAEIDKKSYLSPTAKGGINSKAANDITISSKEGTAILLSDSADVIMNNGSVTSAGSNPTVSIGDSDTFTHSGGTVTNSGSGKAISAKSSDGIIENSSTKIDKVSINGKDAVVVTFESNGAGQSSYLQYIPSGVATKLRANQFTNSGKVFMGWNTQKDGSGNEYLDKGEVNISSSMTLQAQWKSTTGNSITIEAKGDGEGDANAYSDSSHKIEYEIDSAEKGKTVYLYAEADDDSKFIKWVVHSGGVKFKGTSTSTTSRSTTFTMGDEDVVLYAYFDDGEDGGYKVTNVTGKTTDSTIKNPAYVKGSTSHLVVTVGKEDDEDLGEFLGLLLDDIELYEGEEYEVSISGSTAKLTVYRGLLDELNTGSHELTAVFEDGSVSLPLTIKTTASGGTSGSGTTGTGTGKSAPVTGEFIKPR